MSCDHTDLNAMNSIIRVKNVDDSAYLFFCFTTKGNHDADLSVKLCKQLLIHICWNNLYSFCPSERPLLWPGFDPIATFFFFFYLAL